MVALRDRALVGSAGRQGKNPPCPARNALTLLARPLTALAAALEPSRDLHPHRAISSEPQIIDSRSGDGLDGRRRIGSTPAGGGVRSAVAPRVPPMPPRHYRLDEGATACGARPAPSPGTAAIRHRRAVALSLLVLSAHMRTSTATIASYGRALVHRSTRLATPSSPKESPV